MTELSRAAAVLGKKGGQVKGPKGFARSGKASEAGRRTALKRWGRVVTVRLHLIYLRQSEPKILNAAGDPYPQLLKGEGEERVADALLRLIHERILSDPLFEDVVCELAEIDGPNHSEFNTRQACLLPANRLGSHKA